jgi:xanthine dehydrogenase YagS FAD-binding subunit
MAVALTALDAHVVIRGSVGERTIPIDAFYKLPGSAPQIEHDLKTDELIVGVELPPPLNGAGSHYIKIRDRNSYAFALVSTAAIVEVGTDNRIQNARIALGSVAPKPWRVPAAEQALRGKQPGPAAFQVAADLILSGAKPLRYNGFKVEMAKRAVVRALTVASQKA